MHGPSEESLAPKSVRGCSGITTPLVPSFSFPFPLPKVTSEKHNNPQLHHISDILYLVQKTQGLASS